MGKTFTIDIRKLKETNTYNLKSVSTLQINTTYEVGAYKSISAKSNAVTLEMYTTADHSESGPFVTINLKNCDSLQNLYYATSNQGTVYDKEHNRMDFVIASIKAAKITTPDKADGDVVTGTIWDDTIDMHEYTTPVTINALAGDDEITGTAGNDTITGGAGENTIYYSDGNDTVKLTKGEKLTLDYAAANGQEVTYTVGGAKNTDLVINIDNKGSITLANFVKSNVTGANGSVKFRDDCEIPYIDLNNSTIMDYGESDLKWVNKKKTATLTTTRLGDEIDIDAIAVQASTIGASTTNFDPTKIKYSINAGEGKNIITFENGRNTNTIISGSGDDAITIANTSDTTQFAKAVTTVKAGAGQNVITVGGTGKNVLITGKDNDAFNISGTSTTTIKAGGGKNTIALTLDTFGDVVLAEEKIKNTENNISVANIGNTDGEGNKIYSLTKSGNDLVISNASTNSSLTAIGWFLSGGKYSTKTINDYTLAEALDTYGLALNVTGSGTIKGTELSENIYSADSVAGKAKNDKIYAGKGNDTINAGDGKNQIFVYEGDGTDTIENGGGTDTIVFKKGTKYSLSFAETGDTTEAGEDIYDLRIYYSKDSNDYVNIKNAITFDDETYHFNKDATSVTAIKVGNKTYKLESLLNRNKIENVLDKDGNVVGTTKHDDIYVTDHEKFKGNAKVTISGNVGNDYIMVGSNQAVDAENDEYNVDPAEYDYVDIIPTVYTHTTDGERDATLGVYDRVTSYASNGGTYNAQSSISHLQVYGDHNDKYNVYYNDQYTKVYDEMGANDTLNILDYTHENLRLIFTVSKDYQDWSTVDLAGKDDTAIKNLIANSLQEVKLVSAVDREFFLEDPDGNAVGIDIDYWGDKGLSADDDPTQGKAARILALDKTTLAKFGCGVEKIYANDGYYITSETIANVASQVANWLKYDATYGNQFDSVEAVLESGNPEALASVLNVFDTNTVWTNGNS